ncbi:MAG: LuxR C-terminal-related transcriptional regulator [Nocardioides sp.]|uniref:LuxR C-terminal-related transcriptional regulator n=1 Tax=Nocardioides sp. TaxID=35761 RepID=UPI0032661ECC
MATTKSATAGRGALPAELTSFVGRRRELAETRRLLASSRLLTLTGPGGVGKTRLALRMATEVRRTFPDGVWFVELAALHDPQLLPHAVANVLELRQISADPTADLAAYLEEKRLLVVLDNCEHLTDACAVLVSKLLAAAPDLRILATSRHVLGVEGEQIHSVPPLSFPEGDTDPSASEGTHYESVRLFQERAAAVIPGFEIVDSNRAAVVELCRRLDGVPLAIELAAVWLRILSPAQVLDRLEDRFRLLTSGRRAGPARQQALEATVGWSYDLCSPAEQLLWARLSVFSGGFDLEAAEEVCSGDEIVRAEVLSLVASLVNKSIIVRRQATEHTTAWYQMLESIRQYGAERLTDEDEARALRVRHRDYYRSLASRFAAEGFGPQQADWFIRLRRESGNVREAIEFCLADPHEAVAALEITTAIWNFWFAGFIREGYRHLTQALDLATEQTSVRAHGLWAASYLAMFATDFERNATMLAECVEIAAGLDDDLLQARIKECQGQATLYQGDLPGAIELLEQARREFQALGNALGEFDTLILLTACTFFLDDPRATEFSQQALAMAEQHDAQSSMGYGFWSVGIAHWRAGQFSEATRSLRRSVRLFLPMHDLTGVSFGVQSLSWCAAFAEPGERSARLLGAAQAVWRTSGAKVDETNAYSVFDQRSEDALRAAMGSSALDSLRFETAFAEGAAYSFDQAVSLALDEDGDAERSGTTVAPTRSGGRAPGGLTRRESEIAGLLAEGLSNKEIAGRLVISQRTVETHVDHILGKLGITSRAHVAAWVVEQSGPLTT